MAKVVIYSKDYCPYCVQAKKLFDSLGVAYQEIDLSNNQAELIKLVERTKHRTVPQIFINDQFYGGFTDVAALHQAGKLLPLLK